MGVFLRNAVGDTKLSIEGLDKVVLVDAKYFGRYNAAWIPRLYLADSEWRLIDLQKEDESQVDFVKRCLP